MAYNILIPHEIAGKEIAETIRAKFADTKFMSENHKSAAHKATCLPIGGNASSAIDTFGLDNYSYFLIVLNRTVEFDAEKSKLITRKQYSKKIDPFWTFVAGRFPERLVVVRVNPDPEADFANQLCNIDNSRTTIANAENDIDGVAADVVKNFLEVVTAKSESEEDKREILSRWSETKRLLGKYGSANKLSIAEEIPLANRLLHSLEASYYHNDDSDFKKLLDNIEPTHNGVLYFVKKLIVSSIDMFSNSGSDALTKEIPDKLRERIEKDLYEIHAFVEDNETKGENKNLVLWLKWFCDIRLALLLGNKTINPHGSDTQKTKEFIKSSEQALDEINELAQDGNYINLFWGYLYLNKYQIEESSKERTKFIKESVDYFDAFYTNYGRLNVALKDSHLADCFEMEVNFSRYIALNHDRDVSEFANYAEYISDFLEKSDSKKKHSKLQYLHDHFSNLPGSKM